MSTPAATMATPALDAKPVMQVDWLELVAFFSKRGVARLDRLDGALTVQEEDHLSDDATADAIIDERRSLIEDEIEQRERALGEAYPYVLSDDGEELRLKAPAARRGGVFYLLCLIVSHFTKSPILLVPPEDEDIARVRKQQFQVLATFAVAGMMRGPAISLGWPRPTAATILEVLQRVCDMSGTGVPRPAPGQEASPAAKDGGMDVIGWQPANNGLPPPMAMFFAQVASGHNWKAKSAATEIGRFVRSYYLEAPATNLSAVTVIPHRIPLDEHAQLGNYHGHILDRLRTPLEALRGYDFAVEGLHVDGLDAVISISRWVYDFRRPRLAA